MNFVSVQTATRILIVIIACVVIFHLLVLMRVIPFGIVWGGRISSEEELVRFEIVSIAINVVLLVMLGIQAGIIPVRVNRRWMRFFFWAMFGLFLLNTVGNIFSNNRFEQLVFTPMTLVLALLALRVAIGNRGS